MSIVDNHKFGRSGCYGDSTIPFADTFHSILDNVDKHLLEEDTIQTNGNSVISKKEVNMNVSLRTQIFEEWATGLHLLTEVAELQLWLWNLYHFGEACDEG